MTPTRPELRDDHRHSPGLWRPVDDASHDVLDLRSEINTAPWQHRRGCGLAAAAGCGGLRHLYIVVVVVADGRCARGAQRERSVGEDAPAAERRAPAPSPSASPPPSPPPPAACVRLFPPRASARACTVPFCRLGLGAPRRPFALQCRLGIRQLVPQPLRLLRGALTRRLTLRHRRCHPLLRIRHLGRRRPLRRRHLLGRRLLGRRRALRAAARSVGVAASAAAALAAFSSSRHVARSRCGCVCSLPLTRRRHRRRPPRRARFAPAAGNLGDVRLGDPLAGLRQRALCGRAALRGLVRRRRPPPRPPPQRHLPPSARLERRRARLLRLLLDQLPVISRASGPARARRSSRSFRLGRRLRSSSSRSAGASAAALASSAFTRAAHACGRRLHRARRRRARHPPPPPPPIRRQQPRRHPRCRGRATGSCLGTQRLSLRRGLDASSSTPSGQLQAPPPAPPPSPRRHAPPPPPALPPSPPPAAPSPPRARRPRLLRLHPPPPPPPPPPTRADSATSAARPRLVLRLPRLPASPPPSLRPPRPPLAAPHLRLPRRGRRRLAASERFRRRVRPPPPPSRAQLQPRPPPSLGTRGSSARSLRGHARLLAAFAARPASAPKRSSSARASARSASIATPPPPPLAEPPRFGARLVCSPRRSARAAAAELGRRHASIAPRSPRPRPLRALRRRRRSRARLRRAAIARCRPPPPRCRRPCRAAFARGAENPLVPPAASSVISSSRLARRGTREQGKGEQDARHAPALAADFRAR